MCLSSFGNSTFRLTKNVTNSCLLKFHGDFFIGVKKIGQNINKRLAKISYIINYEDKHD